MASVQEEAMRSILVSAILAAIGLSAKAAQTTNPPAFEVVSVKANISVGESGMISSPNAPGQLRVTNIPLRAILVHAYQLRDYQIVGAPDWTRTARFDITAKFPDGIDQATHYFPMMQRMLVDRFELMARREIRELPIYRLVRARGDGRLGSQLIRSTVDCEKWLAEGRPQLGAGGPSAVAPDGKRPACAFIAQRNFLTAGTQTIGRLAQLLESRVGRPVVDATDLQGKFDIDLKWDVLTSGDPQSAAAPAGASPPTPGVSIFTALEEQLGLKLESARGPVEVLAIESINRPRPD
jgi:uncharacterized protein (TIGR03435 family)